MQPRNAEAFSRFHSVASRFCTVVDSASNIDRNDLVLKIYRLLPLLISEAMRLPVVETDDSSEMRGGRERLNQKQWGELYSLLKDKLGDWDLYSQVFDPTKDREAIYGSLADDIADIYRDLKTDVDLNNSDIVTKEAVWQWRFGFYSHWGRHAIEALLTIHCLLEQSLS